MYLTLEVNTKSIIEERKMLLGEEMGVAGMYGNESFSIAITIINEHNCRGCLHR